MLKQVEVFDLHKITVPTYVDDEGRIDLMLENLDIVGNILLTGPTGCGKSHSVLWLAYDVTGAMVVMYQCTEDTMTYHLTGNPDNKGVFQYGPIPVAIHLARENKDREVYLNINEWNMAPPATMSVLNQVTGIEKSIYINHQYWYRPENLKVILTENPWDDPGYAGAVQQNKATRDRFWFIECDYLKEYSEMKMLMEYNPSRSICGKWAAFARRTRDAYKAGEMTEVLTPRKSIICVQKCLRKEEARVYDEARVQFELDNRPVLDKCWGGYNLPRSP